MTDPAPIDSILTSIKKMLGLDAVYTVFDLDITLHINSAFAYLTQLGVGPLSGYKITDANNVWAEFTASDNSLSLESVKTYVYLSVKLVFDPPPTSFGQDALRAQASKLEWLLNVQQEIVRHPIPAQQAAVVYPGGDSSPSVWNLTGLSDFPSNAPINAVGIDFNTGIIYRKTS